MKILLRSLKCLPLLALALILLNGCESTDEGGPTVSGGVYYGVGFYDPWYYGGHYDDVDIIVTPPDTRPPGGSTPPPRPTHPIAPTPPTPGPRPTPMPSIPSRPMPRARAR